MLSLAQIIHVEEEYCAELFRAARARALALLRGQQSPLRLLENAPLIMALQKASDAMELEPSNT